MDYNGLSLGCNHQFAQAAPPSALGPLLRLSAPSSGDNEVASETKMGMGPVFTKGWGFHEQEGRI